MRSMCSAPPRPSACWSRAPIPSVTKADLARRARAAAGKLIQCCVDLGSESVDTRSNAEEALRWLAKHGFHSVRLITSDWHMRRARYEFQQGARLAISARRRRACAPSRASSRFSANIINMCFAASRCGSTSDGGAALAALRGAILSSDLAVGPGRHRSPACSAAGRRLAVVRSWVEMHRWLRRRMCSASARASKARSRRARI